MAGAGVVRPMVSLPVYLGQMALWAVTVRQLLYIALSQTEMDCGVLCSVESVGGSRDTDYYPVPL